MEPEQLTEERGKTHGAFEDNARISQFLKAVLRHDEYSDVQAEAIDMICLKLSRIASGQAQFKDHWDDIAGYAHLVSKNIKE